MGTDKSFLKYFFEVNPLPRMFRAMENPLQVQGATRVLMVTNRCKRHAWSNPCQNDLIPSQRTGNDQFLSFMRGLEKEEDWMFISSDNKINNLFPDMV